MARKGNIGEIRYEVVHVSSSDEDVTREQLARRLRSEQGWVSARQCNFPQEVVLLLAERTNVVKVQIKNHPLFLSQKVDFHLATLEGVEDLGSKPNLCRAANFVRAGMIAFDMDTRYSNDKKTVYMDKCGSVLKLTIHGNYKTDRNPYSQLGFSLLTVFGYSEPTRKLKKVESDPNLRLSDKLSASATNQKTREQTYRKSSYNVGGPPPFFPPIPQLATFSPSFDPNSSFSSRSTNLSDSTRSSRDPVLELQTLQRILNRKKQESVDADKMVLARMCGAAIERLQKAEGEVEFYSRKRREVVLSGGESANASELERKMMEVKEQVVKAVHLELLLEQKEIESIETLKRSEPPPDPSPYPQTSIPPIHPPYYPPYPYYHPGPCPHHHHHPPHSESDSDSDPDSRDSSPRERRPEDVIPPEPYCDDICCNSDGGSAPRSLDPSRRTSPTPAASRRSAPRSLDPSRRSSPTPAASRRSSPPREAGSRRSSHPRDGSSRRSSPPRDAANYTPSGGKDNLPQNTCPFCLETNEAFDRQSKLNGHYTERCPVMIKCPYCGRVVEVKCFDSHKMKTCAMIREQTSPCPICGQASTESQIAEHKDGIGCPGRKATGGKKWCPLCNTEVQDREAAWRDHLMTDIDGSCTANNRKGLSGFPGKEKKGKSKKKSKKGKKPKEKKKKSKDKIKEKKPKKSIPEEETKNVFT